MYMNTYYPVLQTYKSMQKHLNLVGQDRSKGSSRNYDGHLTRELASCAAKEKDPTKHLLKWKAWGGDMTCHDANPHYQSCVSVSGV